MTWKCENQFSVCGLRFCRFRQISTSGYARGSVLLGLLAPICQLLIDNHRTSQVRFPPTNVMVQRSKFLRISWECKRNLLGSDFADRWPVNYIRESRVPARASLSWVTRLKSPQQMGNEPNYPTNGAG
jgi:hypothetical protein